MFKNRSVIEIMVLTFTLLIAAGLMLFGAVVVSIEISDPERDTDAAVDALSHTITTILGALLGLLAGKAGGDSGLDKRPGDHDERE